MPSTLEEKERERRDAQIEKLIARGVLTPEGMLDIVLHGDDADRERLEMLISHPYLTWEPRPDNFKANEMQTAFVNDTTSRLAICLGGTGSGKTDAAAYKTAKYVLETPPPREAAPFWVIAEKFEQVCDVCWGEKLSKLIPVDRIMPNGIRWLDAMANRPRFVQLKHPTLPGKVGWTLYFKSYKEGLGAFTGRSVGGYWCNEEVPFDLLIEIYGRCRDYNSPGWCDFTPVQCKDQAWVDSYSKPPEGWKFYHLNTLENPYISEDWKRTFFATVPEEEREMRTIGRFTSLAGQVYKEYRREIHVVKPFPIPRDWRKIRAIDFGFGHYFCCLWIAFDYDGRAYVYDEHYRNQTLIQDHVKEINKRPWNVPGEEIYYGPTYSDHDLQTRAELGRLGIDCLPANKDDVIAGVAYVRGQMIVQGDGKPRLFFFGKHDDEPDGAERCRNLIREIPGYRFGDGSSTARNTPVKEDDDTLDALRYGLFSSRTRSIAAQASGWKAHVDGKKHGVFGGRRAA